ncbi:hypothetical protein ACI6Q2_04200 [Chitinophagaceae bacterium LWZ2-11]
MKKILFLAAISASLFACTKDTATNNTSTASYLTLYSVVYPSGDSGAHSIGYDGNNNVVRVSGYTKGKTGTVDSGSFYFNFSAGSILPVSYTMVYRKNFYTAASISNHNLYYDSKNRLVTDTTIGTASVTRFTYLGDTILANSFSQTRIVLADTIFLKNGNVMSTISYINGSTTNTDHSWGASAYTSYVSPLYNQTVSSSLGALFIHENFGDFLSKNWQDFGPSAPITFDKSGRISKQTLTDGTRIAFTYK